MPLGTFDLNKAKEIHRSYLRSRRIRELNELDVAYLRADEAGDLTTKQSIAQQKQVLRDMPADSRIDQAASIEELVALSYNALKS